MASSHNPARPATKSRRGQPLRIALGGLLACSVIAGTAWGLVSAFSAMHDADRALSQGTGHLKLAVSDAWRLEKVPAAYKSSRYLRQSDDDVRGIQLSAEAVQSAHQRSVATQLALAEQRRKEEAALLVASATPAKRLAVPAETAVAKPSIVTALVEDVPVQDTQPFGLVLSKKESEDGDAFALPSQIPLPETKPQLERAAVAPKPQEEKPAVRKTPASEDAVAFVKPERSLFGNLFKRKSGEGGWQGNSNRVAIYDVSAATVYLPDGTRLRAHSGIGHMRDNPRYEHVKMNGPTPAGIYRLSMREKRFYGVEAIRMTSIDGRDPKNRTGLLTHTNLLRGRIGSHGCVAFQNYQPFLNAFKRGQVKTLVVVPELPSSSTQLAALYRKAGA